MSFERHRVYLPRYFHENSFHEKDQSRYCHDAQDEELSQCHPPYKNFSCEQPSEVRTYRVDLEREFRDAYYLERYVDQYAIVRGSRFCLLRPFVIISKFFRNVDLQRIPRSSFLSSIVHHVSVASTIPLSSIVVTSFIHQRKCGCLCMKDWEGEILFFSISLLYRFLPECKRGVELSGSRNKARNSIEFWIFGS